MMDGPAMSVEAIERDGRYAESSKGLDRDPGYRAEVLKLGFAEQVWKLMEQQNLSRAELARRLGTSRAYVTKVGSSRFCVGSLMG